MVNSFFFTVFSWFLKLNSAAFFWSLANLFSYLETFFSVGLMLERDYRRNSSLDKDFFNQPMSKSANYSVVNIEQILCRKYFIIKYWTSFRTFKKKKLSKLSFAALCPEAMIVICTYNFPLKSLTAMLSSLICDGNKLKLINIPGSGRKHKVENKKRTRVWKTPLPAEVWGLYLFGKFFL